MGLLRHSILCKNQTFIQIHLRQDNLIHITGYNKIQILKPISLQHWNDCAWQSLQPNAFLGQGPLHQQILIHTFYTCHLDRMTSFQYLYQNIPMYLSHNAIMFPQGPLLRPSHFHIDAHIHARAHTHTHVHIYPHIHAHTHVHVPLATPRPPLLLLQPPIQSYLFTHFLNSFHILLRMLL